MPIDFNDNTGIPGVLFLPRTGGFQSLWDFIVLPSPRPERLLPPEGVGPLVLF